MAAACGLLSLASCSDDENVIINDQPVAEVGTPEIVLQVANTGDGLTTRGGRPLSSSDATQDIDKVIIAIVGSDNTAVLTHEIDNWMSVSSLYETDGHGQQYTWKLTKEQAEKLEAQNVGPYRAYAIGYTSDGDYTFTPDFEDWGTTAFKYVNGEYGSDVATKDYGEEIFAGELTGLTLNEDGEFDTTNGENILTLHRQVTGTFGYFINVPTFPVTKKDDALKATNYADYVEGLKLRLVVSDLNDMVQMGCFNTDFTETGSDVLYVVNGTKKQGSQLSTLASKAKFYQTTTSNFTSSGLDADGDVEGYVAYEISLADWFTANDVNKDGYLGAPDAEGDNWKTPVGISNEVDYQRGTVFAGKFLIPFAKVPKVKTMQLQLVATATLGETDAEIVKVESDPVVVRAWNINLPANDEQLKDNVGGRHVTYLDPDTQEPKELQEGEKEYEEQADSYSMVRNHLYTVGSISEDENIPEDLSKGLNLILRVNDNWEMIHKMEIE